MEPSHIAVRETASFSGDKTGDCCGVAIYLEQNDNAPTLPLTACTTKYNPIQPYLESGMYYLIL